MAGHSRSAALTIGLVVSLGSAGVAQAPAADEEKEHEALRGLKAVYEQALNTDKLELLEPHLDKTFSGVMMTDDPVGDFAAMKAYWQKMRGMIGAGGKYTVTIEPERSLIDGDLAIARGTSKDVVVTGDGKEYRFGTHWTAVCRKRDGAWKLVRVHGSMDPLGNPFVHAEINLAGRWYGGGGLAVGLAAGWLLRWLTARGRTKAA